jgi:hypothetical protein
MNCRAAPAAAALALGLGLSCGPLSPTSGPSVGAPSSTTKRTQPRPGLTELEPGSVPRAAVSKTVYVPVYSTVYTDDAARPYNLAVTLSVRNTDRSEPLVVTAVRYHGADGRLVRDYLSRPLRLAPMAAAEFFVRESEIEGGSSTSFLVDWLAARPVSEPVVEAVMIGAVMNQSVSLLSIGRVVSEPTR